MPRRQSGFALLTVLGMLALFFLSALVYLQAAQGQSELALRQEARLHAYYMARQGLAQVQHEMLSLAAGRQMWRARVDGSWRELADPRGRLRVMTQDETGKLPLMRVSEGTLRRALEALGLKGQALAQVERQIIMLRESQPAGGRASSASRAQGPRNPGELAAWLGLEPGLLFGSLPQNRLWGLIAGQGLLSALTVHGEHNKLNLNAAPPAVLWAAGGLKGEALERFLLARAQGPFSDQAQADSLLGSSSPPESTMGFSVTPGRVYTMAAQARPSWPARGGGVRHSLLAVVRLSEGQLPVTLYWVDDLPLP